MATLPVLVGSDEVWDPSTYMHDVRVEIAFNAGYVTPSADRVWTDVSQWVELHDDIDIDIGRQDERSTADANQLTLTLDNSDGRFTAQRAASPYFPNVKIGRPIRVSVLTATGHTSVRFVGFVDEWPVEWDGTDAYAKATIRASSRLSRLGLSAQLRSAVVEQEILADGPDAYYTLGDPAGSLRASESSGNLGDPLIVTGSGSGTVTFGSAMPGTDGLSGASFTVAGSGYRYLDAPMPASTTSAAFGLGCFFTKTDLVDLLMVGYPTGTNDIGLITMTAAGKIAAGVTSSALDMVTSADSYNDGNVHHVFITSSAGTLTLYVDGVLVGSKGGLATRAFTSLRVGQAWHNGSLSNVEVYGGASPTLPSAARIASHFNAGIGGFVGDTTDERLLRILGWAGIPAVEVAADASTETMTSQQIGDQSLVDALREVESTEGGVLFDGPDGKIHFHNRSRRYLATAAVTLDMAAQHVGADFAPKLDRSTLLNDVTAENPTTGETARAVDTASSDEYGVATGGVTILADSYDALRQAAAWQVVSYAEPSIRIPSLTVDVLAHVSLTPSADDLQDVGVGSRIDVINAPAQADSTDASYFVEGYTETIGPESHSITFNLSPAHPALSTFVLDDADRGELDGATVLGY